MRARESRVAQQVGLEQGSVDQPRGHDARVDDALVAVQVRQIGVEGAGSLLEPRLQQLPLLACDQAGNGVDREHVLLRALAEQDGLALGIGLDRRRERGEVSAEERLDQLAPVRAG